MPEIVEPADRTAVVTGAAGWLGQNLVRELAARGWGRIRCLVLDPSEAALLEVIDPRISTVVGDVRLPEILDRLFEDHRGATVFHTAGVIHPPGRTRTFFDVNVGGTQNALDRARRAGARRFVHISSNSPAGANERPTDRFREEDPPNPYLAYGRSKLEAEDLVSRTAERGDLETVVLRPPWFYGPFQPARQAQWFTAIRKGRFPLIGDGTQQRSMAYVGNLADACILAADAPAAVGRTYWIADAEPYELRRIYAGVREALAAEGFDVTHRNPPSLPRFAATAAVAADRGLQSLDRYVQPLHVLGELRDTIACDIGRAREELGYEPEVSLVEGMRRSIRWCVERGIAL